MDSYCIDTHMYIFYNRYDPEKPNDPHTTGWLHVDGNDSVDPADFTGSTFQEFVLNMTGKMVLAEERQYQRFFWPQDLCPAGRICIS